MRYRKIDGNSFTATIYQDGNKAAACSIRLGGVFGNAISYSNGDSAPVNSMSESCSVENDDQKMYLHLMGMSHFGSSAENSSLSDEGAAEYYWSLLIRPLQGH